MRGLVWAMIALGLMASLAAAGPGLPEAEAALSAGRAEEARQILGDPSLQADPAALMMLGVMTAEGQGGPADPVEAYALFTRVFMLGEPDPRAEAMYRRRQVAHDLTPDRILAAEARVVAWVDAHEGSAAARRARAGELAAELTRCDPSFAVDACFAPALEVLALGPAAPEVVAPLERLMTRDPHWVNRETYAWALGGVGSAAIPALCGVMLDRQQLQLEGSWNAEQTAFVLGRLGEVARPALPCLVEPLSWRAGDISKEAAGLAEQMGQGDVETLLLGLKECAVFAMARIGDPDRVVLADLTRVWQTAENPELALTVAWGIAANYQDTAPAVASVTTALATTDDRVRLVALLVLTDLAQLPGFAARVTQLRPDIEALRQKGPASPELAKAAEAALRALWP